MSYDTTPQSPFALRPLWGFWLGRFLDAPGRLPEHPEQGLLEQGDALLLVERRGLGVVVAQFARNRRPVFGAKPRRRVARAMRLLKTSASPGKMVFLSALSTKTAVELAAESRRTRKLPVEPTCPKASFGFADANKS